MTLAVPPGFTRLTLPPAGFIDANGPLYGRLEDGRLVMGIRIEARHCNAVGTCHGGMLTMLADMLLAMGSNLQANLSSFLMTVSLNCDFLDVAPLGAWVEGRLEVLRITRTLVFSQGVLAIGERPVLRANAVLKRPAQPDAAHAIERLLPSA